MLPKIEIPKYFLTIPSNGDTIEYRPFLVKEEKVLMIAQETNTQSAMVAAMKDVIKACTFNQVDVYSIAMSDLEYILLQIRSKSVGELTFLLLRLSKAKKRKIKFSLMMKLVLRLKRRH